MTQKIAARCVIDILGSPQEFIEKALKDHIEKVRNDGIVIITEKYEPPVQKDKLFSQIVELQVECKDMKQFFNFCFDSMPSSVEMLSPEKLTVDMRDFEEFINDFQAKLHHTDMMLKGIHIQKQLLDKNAINIFHNFIKYACKVQPYGLEELSKLLGIGVKELTPFVEHLVSKGTLKKEGSKFIANE